MSSRPENRGRSELDSEFDSDDLDFSDDDDPFDDDDSSDEFGSDDLDDDEFDDDELDNDISDEVDFGSDDDLVGFGGASALPSLVLKAEEFRLSHPDSFSGISFKKLGQNKRADKEPSKMSQATSNFFASIGQGISSSGASYVPTYVPVIFPSSPPPQPVVTAVSDRETLPPVYVPDPALASHAESAPASVSASASPAPSSSFGASFEHGSLRHRTGADKQSMIKAKILSRKSFGSVRPASPLPFVEDSGATPVLLSDGAIIEPFYGGLQVCPCPSCCSLPKDSYGSTGNGCVVCSDYGAILIPEKDVHSYFAPESYGFVAALMNVVGPIAQAGAQVAASSVAQSLSAKNAARQQEGAARTVRVFERLRSKIAAAHPPPAAPQPSSDPSPPNEPASFGALVHARVIRVLVPKGSAS